MKPGPGVVAHEVRVPTGDVWLDGTLALPAEASGVVLFAHGSGSSRHSPRNRYVASVLHEGGLGTLLIDLLTADEERVDLQTRHLRFDIGLLTQRLSGAMAWLSREPDTSSLAIGLFGSSTGGGAALVAAAQNSSKVSAVVSRGGRPDLAGEMLPRVEAPTLLIVGGDDRPVIGLNQEAMRLMRAPVRLEIIPGASHLFEEPDSLEQVARLARDWFHSHLGNLTTEQ